MSGLCVWVPWVRGEFPIDPPDDNPGWWICKECGKPRTLRFAQPDWTGATRACKNSSQEMHFKPLYTTAVPSVEQNPPRQGILRTYLQAKARWESVGCPLRTVEEKEILYEICSGEKSGSPCDSFRAMPLKVLGGYCDVCRCGLHHERDTVNKTAWATEDCPKGLWRKSGVTFVDAPIYKEILKNQT